MPNITIPVPTLRYKSEIPGVAVLEKPFEVYCAPINLADGSEFDHEAVREGKGGFFVYRQKTAASAMEIWNDNEDAKRWEPEQGINLNNGKPTPFVYKKGDPSPWQGLFVAAGKKDKSGSDQFSKAMANYPQYFFRAYFASPFLFRTGSELQGDLDNRKVPEGIRRQLAAHGISLSANSAVVVEIKGSRWLIKDNSNNKTYAVRRMEKGLHVYTSADDANLTSGLSALSPVVRFVSLIDAIRAGIKVKEDETPETAMEIQFFLRNANLSPLGTVEIKNDNGAGKIEIVKWDAGSVPVSKISIHTDGSIEIVSRAPDIAHSASVRLAASGDINVQPAQGKSTTINNTLVISESNGNITLRCNGELTLEASKVNINAGNDEVRINARMYAEEIEYQPYAIGGRRWLS